MAIDTNALTLGSSLPAKSSFQARASGTGASQVANDQNPDADAGAQPGGSTAAAQDCAGDSPVQAPATAQKPIGPAAPTRANARTARAPATPGGPTATASSTDTTDAADNPSTNFVSVMATALGRSAATTAEPTVAAKAATSTADSTTAAQPAAATPADAVAWIAQVLMPSATAAQPSPGKANANSATGSVSVTGTGPAIAGPATAGAALLPGLPGNATAAGALRNPIKGESSPQTPVTQSIDPKTQAPQVPQADSSATSLDNVNAMADVQKLISGLTAASTADAGNDTGDDTASATVTHAAAATGADSAPAAAALQAAGLNRSDSTLGNATLSIQAPVSSAAFADEVSARVTGLAQSGITQAQLQLSPADLGPVQVHITLQSGQASVWFGATHADTRAALEQSLPRLRELFAGAGMPLTDSGVFREPPQQQPTQSPAAAGSSRTGGETLTAPTVTQVTNIRLALLDTYA